MSLAATLRHVRSEKCLDIIGQSILHDIICWWAQFLSNPAFQFQGLGGIFGLQVMRILQVPAEPFRHIRCKFPACPIRTLPPHRPAKFQRNVGLLACSHLTTMRKATAGNVPSERVGEKGIRHSLTRHRQIR